MAHKGPWRLTAAIENARSMDRAADAVGEVAAKVAASPAGRTAAAGTWLGHPAHPMLVSLPIGFFTGSLLLDARGESQAARTLVGAGLLATAPAALTGLADWRDTSGAERRVGLVHIACNSGATALYATSWVARRRGRHVAGTALAAAGAALLGAGGWLGGHLAYSLGVGVDTNAFDAGSTDWVELDVEVPDGGRPVRADAGPTPVMATRQADGVKVLAERCSHRGGPLSEGSVDRGCVTCPWHGSRFSLEDGSVVTGPATAPQPAYEVREDQGRLSVRRREERALRNNTVKPGR